MKQVNLLVAVLALAVAGCKPREESTVITGANGEKVTATRDGSKVSVTDDKGNTSTMNTGGVSEADLGLPFYPGSVNKARGASMAIDSPEGKVVASTRTTSDDPDKVADFYKDKVEGAKPTTMKSEGTAMASIGGKLKNGAEVAMVAVKKGTEDTDISVTVKTTKAK